jgi:hypothetical protein
MAYLHTLIDSYIGSDGDFLCAYSKKTRIPGTFSHTVPKSNKPLPDATVECTIFTHSEIGIGIIAGSLATLRPLFHKATCLLQHGFEVVSESCGSPTLARQKSGGTFVSSCQTERWREFGSTPNEFDQLPNGHGVVTRIQGNYQPRPGPKEKGPAKGFRELVPWCEERREREKGEGRGSGEAGPSKLVVNIRDEFGVS